MPAGWMSAELSSAPDEALLKRIAKRDRDALAAFYQRFQRPVFQYLLTLTADRAVAEEILQDTFFAVWKAAGKFEARSSVLTWLIGIARRQAHNVLRKASLPRADESELSRMESDDTSPEDAALAGADRDMLAAAIAQLSAIHREILVLTFAHGLSYPELAKVLEVPVGTVKSRLSNAKRALRARLAAPARV